MKLLTYLFYHSSFNRPYPHAWTKPERRIKVRGRGWQGQYQQDLAVCLNRSLLHTALLLSLITNQMKAVFTRGLVV